MNVTHENPIVEIRSKNNLLEFHKIQFCERNQLLVPQTLCGAPPTPEMELNRPDHSIRLFWPATNWDRFD